LLESRKVIKNNNLQTSLQKDSEKGQKTEEKLLPELAEVVKTWPDLPEHIKQAIMALIRTNKE
jgi:hypothetical protein